MTHASAARTAALALLATGCRNAAAPSAGYESAIGATVIERGVTCVDCTLALTRIGTLGSPSDSILLDRRAFLTRLDDGRYIVAPTVVDGVAALFDSVGAPARAIGRRGQGPGENQLVRGAYHWHGDRVLLLGAGDRLGWLDGSSMRETTARTAKPWLLNRGVTLPDDGVVVANAFYEEQPLVVIDSNGSDRRWIGTSAPRDPHGHGRYYALGPGNEAHTFWAAPLYYKLHFELWNVDGTLERSIDRSPDWFTPYDTARFNRVVDAGDRAERPFPQMHGVRETKDGVLWGLYDVAAADWRADQTAADAKPTRPDDLYHIGSYDGIIQLLDSHTGDLLLTARIDRPLRGFVDDSTVYELRETQGGYWFIDLYRARFARQ
ncbi:MAG TPA: hypothetical protein VGM20_13815 [Gemmatimonadales bacterium]